MARGRHAEIAGGGIAGLAAAVFLTRIGWSVRVHERNPQILEVGAGLMLKPNSVSVLTEAGVFDKLRLEPARVTGSAFKDKSGKLLAEYPNPEGLPWSSLLRQELVNALRERAEELGAEILTNSEIADVRSDGALETKQGDVLHGDLVIGADGWRSLIRERLHLGWARQLPHGASRIVIPRQQDETSDVYEEYWSGGRRVGLSPLNPHLLYVFLSCPEKDREGSAVPIDVETYTSAFPGLERSLFERIRAGELVRHPYGHVGTRGWFHKQVALLGDAATSHPPTLAQGAGLAVMNAVGLAEELAQTDDVKEAIARWESRYRPISDKTQRWSLRYLRASGSWMGRYARLQAALVAISRTRLLNARMRIADRVVAGRSGPVEISR